MLCTRSSRSHVPSGNCTNSSLSTVFRSFNRVGIETMAPASPRKTSSTVLRCTIAASKWSYTPQSMGWYSAFRSASSRSVRPVVFPHGAENVEHPAVRDRDRRVFDVAGDHGHVARATDLRLATHRELKGALEDGRRLLVRVRVRGQARAGLDVKIADRHPLRVDQVALDAGENGLPRQVPRLVREVAHGMEYAPGRPVV